MPRIGKGKIEKSKDFKGSIKRLLSNLKPWKFLLLVSLILAITSSVLALISPDKLSELTDTITLGIKPDTKKLEEITTNITNNLSKENLQSKINVILNDENISNTDKQKLNSVITSGEFNIELVPDSIMIKFFSPINIDGTIIDEKDQVEFIKLIYSIEEKNETELLKLFDKLPSSIYELVKPKVNLDKVKEIGIFIACLYLVSALAGYIQNFSMTTISNKFAKKLRTRITNKINKLPLKYFDTHENGDILSRVTNDVDAIAQNLNQSLATLISSITLFIGSIIMMFSTNWIMALTAIASSIIGFSFMGLILGKSQKYFTKKQEELGNLNGYIEEIYSGHNIVKAYNGEKSSIEEFKKLNYDLYDSNKKSQFLSGIMMPMMGFIGNFGYVAVCIVGALLVSKGIITFGTIIAFIVYVRLFTNPLSQIAQAMTSLQSIAAASERVFEFLDEVELKDEKDFVKFLDKNKVKGKIEFKNVCFGYDDTKTIIKDFSVTVNPGEKVAIVGPTGAGKTTLVNLLMKFYEISDGDILIDGVSIKELTRENIHDLFCMVLQDTWLFSGTIGENIKYNKENITDEEILNACKVVGVDHFIKTLPLGLDAQIGDNNEVSGGQKQLFTIARGMVKNSPFLILDEATSNVDTRTEELVQKAMDELTVGKTSFIIAHRLSTIKNANIILVMKEGEIVEQGTHDELIDKNGFYAELYNSQFKKETREVI